MSPQSHPEVVIDGEKLEAAYEALRAEYNVTMRVLAVVTERLLEATGAAGITVSDEAQLAAPSIDATRNASLKTIYITISR